MIRSGFRQMNPSTWFGANGDRSLQVLWEDGECAFCRGERDADGHRAAVLAVFPTAEQPTPATFDHGPQPNSQATGDFVRRMTYRP
jgi:hypothetical protein